MTFESETTKQNLLKLHSVLQCKHSASTCKGPVFNKFNSRSTSSKETKILLFKLGRTYAGSEDPKYCSWIRDSFSRKLCVGKTTQPSTFKSETIKASQGGTQGMLLKGAIQPVSPFKNQYLSNLFLVSKRDGGNIPIINLKHLNNSIPYQRFKMDYYKICSRKKTTSASWTKKDDFFWFSLKKETRKYIRFHWEVTLYEFLCLCFGLSPATLIFTKI